MNRRTAFALTAALAAALLLTACGPGAGKGNKSNPAEPGRTSPAPRAPTGFDKDGKPIDAVAGGGDEGLRTCRR